MRRAGNLFDRIVDVDNIALAAYKAFRGKTCAREIREFRDDFMGNLLKIRTETVSGEIELGNYKQFDIYEPKKRRICAAPLPQRVLHHAIMNVCHDIFDRQLIYDCYASRPMKGTHKAILRVQQESKKYKYFVKLDIRKFFDSVNHEVLKRLLTRLIKDFRLLQLFNRIVDSYGEGCGLPIGNLTSQYFANYYLSPADHHMKEIMKAPVYVRYMDDVVIMAKEKDALLTLMRHYCNYVSENLNLAVKPPIVGKVCNGIPFLGYRIFRDKIMMNGKGKRRFRKNIKMLGELFEKSVISEREYASRLQSNVAYAGFADSYAFRRNVLG